MSCNVTGVTSDEMELIVSAPQTLKLLWMLPVALCFAIARYLLSRFVSLPLGLFLGLKESQRKSVESNAILENAFRQNKKVKAFTVRGLSKKLAWPERKVGRWFRLRAEQSGQTTLQQFADCCWALTVHSTSFVYTAFHLSNNRRGFYPDVYWSQLEKHDDTDAQYFTIILLGYIVYETYCLLLSPNKHRTAMAFYMMLVHHVNGFFLFLAFYVNNICLLHVISIFLHDITDIFLQIFKLLRLIKQEKLSKIFTVVFALSWLIARLVLFPLIVWRSIYYNMSIYLGFTLYYVAMNAHLTMVIVLNTIWAKQIVVVLYAIFSSGNKTLVRRIIDEANPESEEEEEEEDDFEKEWADEQLAKPKKN